MIATSRYRTYREERIIATAEVKAKRATRISGSNSQLQVGDTPEARMKTKTAIRFRARLNDPVSTVARGMTRRGNWVLRTTPSWATTDVTEVLVASWKKVNSTMFISSSTG